MLKRLFAPTILIAVMFALFVYRRVHAPIVPVTSAPVTVVKLPVAKLSSHKIAKSAPVAPNKKEDETLVGSVRAWRTKIPVDKNEEQKIIRAAQDQRDDELAQNAELVADPNTDGETRWSALFVLASAGPRAAPYLERIVTTPFAKNKVKGAADQELSLRITALSNLDQYAVDGSDMSATFQTAMTESGDPTLRMLATVALQGSQQKRPGKLIRYMDHLLRR